MGVGEWNTDVAHSCSPGTVRPRFSITYQIELSFDFNVPLTSMDGGQIVQDLQ